MSMDTLVAILVLCYAGCWGLELYFAKPLQRIKIIREAAGVFIIVGLMIVLAGISGCAPSQPLAQAEVLGRQVEVERRQRACLNVQGIWINGRCDWTPLL